MNKLLAALIATLFATCTFAADAPAKKDDKAAAPAAAAKPAKAEKADKAEKKEEKKADKTDKK
jgi:ribosomal protein L12E/L44/L45/RPP1/RPP2